MFDKEKLDLLEGSGQWAQAKDLLYKEWEVEKTSELAIRFCMLCWYVLVFWERIDNSNLSQDEYLNYLPKVAEYCLENFSSNTEVLCYLGYMTSTFPYYFGNYETWLQKGKEMLFKAHDLDTRNPIITMLLINNDGDTEYKEACVKAKELVLERFNGRSLIDEYFRNVLVRNVLL